MLCVVSDRSAMYTRSTFYCAYSSAGVCIQHVHANSMRHIQLPASTINGDVVPAVVAWNWISCFYLIFSCPCSNTASQCAHCADKQQNPFHSFLPLRFVELHFPFRQVWNDCVIIRTAVPVSLVRNPPSN